MTDSGINRHQRTFFVVCQRATITEHDWPWHTSSAAAASAAVGHVGVVLLSTPLAPRHKEELILLGVAGSVEDTLSWREGERGTIGEERMDSFFDCVADCADCLPNDNSTHVDDPATRSRRRWEQEREAEYGQSYASSVHSSGQVRGWGRKVVSLPCAAVVQ